MSASTRTTRKQYTCSIHNGRFAESNVAKGEWFRGSVGSVQHSSDLQVVPFYSVSPCCSVTNKNGHLAQINWGGPTFR